MKNDTNSRVNSNAGEPVRESNPTVSKFHVIDEEYWARQMGGYANHYDDSENMAVVGIGHCVGGLDMADAMFNARLILQQVKQ